jgi:hypothetical protein
MGKIMRIDRFMSTNVHVYCQYNIVREQNSKKKPVYKKKERIRSIDYEKGLYKREIILTRRQGSRRRRGGAK